MTDCLPKKLKKEPIIDAVFEWRFKAHQSFAEIVPGALFGHFSGNAQIQRLPAAELPRPLRDQDPNLRFAPLFQLHLDKYTILIGDRIIALTCKLPYPGWNLFKSEINKLAEVIQKIALIETIDRYSIKYVNVIPAETIIEQLTKTTLSITLADQYINSDNLSLRIEKRVTEMLHVIQIVTGANAQKAEKKFSGIAIDIDTIVNLKQQPFDSWIKNLPEASEQVRKANKEIFFSCLTSEAIEEMEPVYD